MRAKPWFIRLLATLLVCMAGQPLLAGSDGAAAAVAPVDSVGSAAAGTGSTPGELASMRASNPIPARDDAAVELTVGVAGSRWITLDESFRSTVVVRTGADGRPIYGCVHSRDEFERFFADNPAPAQLEVR
jgi:hypothetical protein